MKMKATFLALATASCWAVHSASAVTYFKLPLKNPSPDEFSSFGRAVAGIGDVNGDGVRDVLVSDPGWAVGGIGSAGAVHVFSGKDRSLLYTIPHPEPQEKALFGLAVADAGDVNGDGVSDVLVGAPFHGVNGSRHGMAYLFNGVNGSLIYAFDGSSLNPLARLGAGVANAGDLTADGFPDLLIGAPAHKVAGAGQGVVFVINGANGIAYGYLSSPEPDDGALFGSHVTGIADVNGDGIRDLMVSAPRYANIGKVFLLSGFGGGLIRSLQDPNPPDPAAGKFGIISSIAEVGDVDSDAVTDLVVATNGGEVGPNGLVETGPCKILVFSGATGGVIYALELAPEDKNHGLSVAGPGDTDGNGTPDVLVGDTLSKQAAILDGSSGVVISAQDLGTNGDAVAVAGAGNLNFGGLPDMIVGVYSTGKNGSRAMLLLSADLLELLKKVLEFKGEGERKAMASQVEAAVHQVDLGHTDVAIKMLQNLRRHVDGEPLADKDDWVLDAESRRMVRGGIDDLITDLGGGSRAGGSGR